MPRWHCLVSGRVQGVSYRESARRRARREGIAGWVRNLPDGRVEAVLEGPAEALERMVAWMRRGPALARVDGVDHKEEQEEGLQGFEVRR